MEQLVPVLVVGFGFVVVLTLVRALASMVRMVILAVLAVALVLVVTKTKLPFSVTALKAKLSTGGYGSTK